MKIYNKKRFLSGIIFCGMGTFSLIKDFATPSNIVPLQIKHLFISVLLFLIGAIFVIRALSKTKTEEDLAEETSIRNHIVKCKSRATAFSVLQDVLFVSVVVCLIGFYMTENMVVVTILIVVGLLLTTSWIIELFTTIHYEKEQQGDDF